MKYKPVPWWKEIWPYLRHPFCWEGDLPCPFMYIGPFLITWSKYDKRPWWQTIGISFMPD